MLSCPYFVKKTSILPKARRSHFNFFKYFIKKTLCCHAQIWLEERQFCHNDTILLAKKINRMPFFSDFELKNHSSHAHLLSKKRPFSIKHNDLMPIFCQKNVNSLKIIVVWYNFLQIFHEKPQAVMPIFVRKKKRQFSQHYTILWAKKVNRMPPLFPIFDEKITALMPILCQKNVHSLNNTLLSCSVFFPRDI